MNKISQLPIGSQIRFVQDALQREKKMRSTHLTGINRDVKMQEADDCLECMISIEKNFRKLGIL